MSEWTIRFIWLRGLSQHHRVSDACGVGDGTFLHYLVMREPLRTSASCGGGIGFLLVRIAAISRQALLTI